MDLPTKIRKHVALLVCLFLVGCSIKPAPEASYNTNIEQRFPPVSVYQSPPSQQLVEQCDAYKKAISQSCNIRTFALERYQQSLNDSEMFDQALIADPNAEYKIAIATVLLHQDELGDIPKGLLSGMTLMLVPLTEEQEVRAEVSVYWHKLKIKQYDYQLPYVSQISLFNKGDEEQQTFSRLLTSHFIADAQRDNVFSSQYLSYVLDATDYQRSLIVPEQIGNFKLVNQYIFRNPLLGAISTYIDPDFANDKIDLFVYPIPRPRYENYAQNLPLELQRIKEELATVGQEQHWQELHFSNDTPIKAGTSEHPLAGLSSVGTYRNQLGEESYTSIYLFADKDKFIKFRATFPEQFITPQIRQSLARISVPEASTFMTKLRLELMKKAEENAASAPR